MILSNNSGTCSSMDEKPTILVCAEYYLPGFRAGGPIRSLSNLVEHLSDDFRFKVLTADRDHGVDEPYDDIHYGEWMEVGPAEVRYLSPAERSFPCVARLFRTIEYDLLYVNSLYSMTYSLPGVVLSKLGLLSRNSVVVAPRGQLASSAIAQGSPLKRPYLYTLFFSGLYDDVVWHATNDEEAEQVRRWFGNDARVRVAPNFGSLPASLSDIDYESSEQGELKAVYLSRVHPVKNLDFAVERLAEVDGDVTFDIFGPIDDREYFEKCRAMAESLPSNVHVTFHGPVSSTQVFEKIRRRDVFVLPTQGENFGHVIFEALAAGSPVLISDQTPWSKVSEEDVGRALPLDAPERFTEYLQSAIDTPPERLRELGERAREFAESEAKLEESVSKTRAVFDTALTGR